MRGYRRGANVHSELSVENPPSGQHYIASDIHIIHQHLLAIRRCCRGNRGVVVVDNPDSLELMDEAVGQRTVGPVLQEDNLIFIITK